MEGVRLSSSGGERAAEDGEVADANSVSAKATPLYESWGKVESWIAFIVIIIFVIVATVLQAYFMKGV